MKKQSKILTATFILVVLFFIKAGSSVHGEELRGYTPAGHLPGYHEKEGYADVYGDGEELHYWLYNTYIDYKGDAEPLFEAIFDYYYYLGWDYIYDNQIIPNHELAKSVKQLMIDTDSDVSMAVSYYLYNGFDIIYVSINNHDRKKDVWSTLIVIYGRDINK